MKRKLYLVAIGVVVAHLSMAQIFERSQSGDCVDCARKAQAIPFQVGTSGLPLNKDLLAKFTGFSAGNGAVGALANQNVTSNMATDLFKQAQEAPPPAQPKWPVIPEPKYYPNGFPKPDNSADTNALRDAYSRNDVRAIMGILPKYMPEETFKPFTMSGYAAYGYGSPFPPFN